MEYAQTPAVAPLRVHVESGLYIAPGEVSPYAPTPVTAPLRVISDADARNRTPSLSPDDTTPRPIIRTTAPPRRTVLHFPVAEHLSYQPPPRGTLEQPPQLGTLERPHMTPPPRKVKPPHNGARFSAIAIDFLRIHHTDPDGFVRAPAKKAMLASGLLSRTSGDRVSINKYSRQINGLRAYQKGRTDCEEDSYRH